ncbi:S8 family serine peptidase [Haliangium ochraceum]|uniref:Peptidase S8 and S53 subtilisin kexin sedolisin n=1 Tax=Haliangium ochraceum (strain DSM 14365 / JCM 11303 / SMP-2) TaxID=502025 RepID=D0LHK8_HALO1|nr:S8 family serine peptidase [Haliangium ochraceum]ACY12870.1 peptidase S8 and S53 subtilisin kexin sedolisin [Haliangium ochraceum DSM 14365]
MKKVIRPWLFAAGLPLFFGPAVGCDGGLGDIDTSPAGEAPAQRLPGDTEAAAPGGGNGDDGSAGNESGVGDPALADKPASFVRDLRDDFVEEPGLTGEHSYIVHFRAAPLATYSGGVTGLAATNPRAAGTFGKLDANSPASRAYKSYLLSEQASALSTIEKQLGRRLKSGTQYTTAINATLVRMSQDEAKRVSRMAGVRFVERDQAVWPETDRGPIFIGAPGIWDGSATGMPSEGEGITVGIIDSGMNIQAEIDGVTGAHPSFAEMGDDGYVHTNPLGSGVYLGGCVDNPEWCNDKLIGVFSFLNAQPNPGVDPNAPDDDPLWGFKDTSGHGSHVASTAAGNVLFDVPVVDADGNPSSFSYERISGVAPHANLVSFKVCAPSCFFSDIAGAVEQAIEDGVVDVLNQSIGNSGGSPWNSTSAQAFLSARAAGIFVAASAGNDGPDPGTAGRGNSAPWVAGVAATSHDRRFPDKFLTDMAGGDTPPPPELSGLTISGGISGRLVYAGEFPVGNPGEPNFDQPEQCLEPFPAGTFEPDMIVVCDRGAIARTAKGQNVRDGGAGGLVLANLAGGATSVVADPHVLPAIHIDAAQGDLLRAWLASGSGHTGTITATEQPVSDLSAADIMASFSSRGPYDAFDILAPNVAAPGLSIFAAGAQVLFDHPGSPSVPGLFGTIQGTSMASPHVAGAAALMKSVHPDWSDAEILSAFMTTGQTEVRKEDGVTPADPLDYGGGRVRVDLAAQVALVFDQSAEGFAAANPALGGDPLALNVAALTEDVCISNCVWQRTVRAVRAGSFAATGTAGITIEPAAFTLAEGEEMTLTFTANTDGLPEEIYGFGAVTITSDIADAPVQTMQVVIKPGRSNIPRAMSIEATRDRDSRLIDELRAVPIPDLSVTSFGLSRAQVSDAASGADSDTSSPFDDLEDGVHFELVPFPDFAQQFIAETMNSTSPDLDLFVGLDLNGDGLPSEDELYCSAATASAAERCTFELGGDLSDFPDFWVLVQNFRASTPGAVDTYDIATTSVGVSEDGALSLSAPSAVPGGQPFSARVVWDAEMSEGELYYGRLSVFSDSAHSDASSLGNIDVRLLRGPDDVQIIMPPRLRADEVAEVTVRVQPNHTDEPRAYDIVVPVEFGLFYMPGSAAADGGIFEDGAVRFSITRAPNTTEARDLHFRVHVRLPLAGVELPFTETDAVDLPFTEEATSVAFANVQYFTFMGFLPPLVDGSTVVVGEVATAAFRLRLVTDKSTVFNGVADATVYNADGEPVAEGLFLALGTDVLEFDFDTAGLEPGEYTVVAELTDTFVYSMTVNLVAP